MSSRAGARVRVTDGAPAFWRGSRHACPGTLRVMLLTAAPSLAYVIGLPAGLLLAVVAVGVGAWALIGRISRG